MLMIIGTSVLSLVAWGIFNHKYPKPAEKRVEDFKPNPVFSVPSFISPNPKVWDHKFGGKRYRAYKFKCSISPRIAMMGGQKVKMSVPEKYNIKEFTVLVDPVDGAVHYVHLGRNQYHCDLDQRSHCMCLQELYLETFDQVFLKALMELLLTYELLDSYSQDHWENEEFINMNKELITAIQEKAA